MGLFSKFKKAHRASEKIVKQVIRDQHQTSTSTTNIHASTAFTPKPTNNNFKTKASNVEDKQETALSATPIADTSDTHKSTSPLSDIEGNKKWTATLSPEEEYSLFETGNIEQKLIDYENGYGNYSTKERKDIAAPEPCGFQFNNAIVQTHDSVDFETGELSNNPLFVTPDLNNLSKIMDDWIALTPFWESVATYIPDFPMNKVLYYIKNLHQLPHRNNSSYPNNIFRDYDYCAHIAIEPLTKTGKVKKHPIQTTIQIAWSQTFDEWYGKAERAQEERLFLLSHYQKDGKIGKGKINYSFNQTIFILDFSFDSKSEEYFVKKARMNEGMSLDGWRILYP